jgi:hypothetical protein
MGSIARPDITLMPEAFSGGGAQFLRCGVAPLDLAPCPRWLARPLGRRLGHFPQMQGNKQAIEKNPTPIRRRRRRRAPCYQCFAWKRPARPNRDAADPDCERGGDQDNGKAARCHRIALLVVDIASAYYRTIPIKMSRQSLSGSRSRQGNAGTAFNPFAWRAPGGLGRVSYALSSRTIAGSRQAK